MKHLQLEREAWLRALDYIQEENIYFKTNLAFIIKNDIDIQTLEEAEHFHSIFINNDSMIALLRHDILELSRMTTDKRNNKNNMDSNEEMQDKIRNAITLTEDEFNKLKMLFSAYLAKALL